MVKRVLDIVDDQIGFMVADSDLPVPGADKIIAATDNFFKQIKKGDFDFALFKQDTHFSGEYPSSPESEAFPNIHCEYGTKGWDLAVNPQLIKDTPIYYMTKNVFDMWSSNPITEDVSFKSGAEKQAYSNLFNVTADPLCRKSGLPRDKFLKGVGKDTEVVMIGVASDFCVHDAMLGYLKKGAKVTVLTDLVRGIGTPVPGRAPSGNIEDVAELPCFKPYLDSGQLSLTTSAKLLTSLNAKPTARKLPKPKF